MLLHCKQYDSGTGWPSFYAPVDPEHIIERVDPHDQATLPKILWRTEVLDRKSGTHLGHVFPGKPNRCTLLDTIELHHKRCIDVARTRTRGCSAVVMSNKHGLPLYASIIMLSLLCLHSCSHFVLAIVAFQRLGCFHLIKHRRTEANR
jgi:SelR domain